MKSHVTNQETKISSSKSIFIQRVKAAVLDHLLLLALFFLVLFLIGKETDGRYVVNGPLSLFPIVLWFVYFVIMEQLIQGSVGKLLFEIKIVSIDGRKLTFWQVILRRLADIVEIWWCCGQLAYVVASRSPLSQRLGDKWAKAVVVARR